MPEISLAAEKLFTIGGFPVTNSLLATWIVMAILFTIAYLTRKNLKMIPSRGQSIVESLIGGLYDFFASVAGHHVKAIFPVVASLFLFIIIGNWIGLLPGVGTVGFREPVEHAAVQSAHEATVTERTEGISEESAEKAAGTETAVEAEETKFVPILRGATADLNTTIALALVAVFAMQYFGFKNLGMGYGKRYLNLTNPINFFIGILEIVSDTSKIVSFAFRLYGNIFAGEVLLTVMATLMPFLAPLPFLVLELFVGFIQALVFSTLTAVFVSVAVSHEEH